MTHEKSDKLNKSSTRIQEAEEEVEYYESLLDAADPVLAAIAVLEKQRPFNAPNIKESCQFELQRFIDERGSIDKKSGTVHIPVFTVTENHARALSKNIKAANDLIKKLERIGSLDEMIAVLKKADPTSNIELEIIIQKYLLIAGEDVVNRPR